MSAPNATAVTALHSHGYTLVAGPERGNWRTDLAYREGQAKGAPIGELTTNINDGSARLERGRQASMPEWKIMAEALGGRAHGEIRFKS